MHHNFKVVLAVAQWQENVCAFEKHKTHFFAYENAPVSFEPTHTYSPPQITLLEFDLSASATTRHGCLIFFYCYSLLFRAVSSA